MKSTVSINARRFLLGIAIVTAVCVMMPQVLLGANGSCPSCSLQSGSENPFANSRHWYAPVTFGLPMGQAAPTIEGVEFSGHRTIVAILNGRASPEAAVLGELPATGAQVVAVLHGFDESAVTKMTKDFRGKVIVIPDPTAYIVCAEYRVGSAPCVNPIAFFVNKTGTIIYRRIGTLGWLGYDNDKVVKYFASYGKLPPDVYPQHVLWYGDKVPIPPFPLKDLDGHNQQLSLTRVTLFYSGASPSSERGHLLFPKLNQLRKEFPQIRFVWVLNYRADDEMAALYRLYNRLGLTGIAPQWLSIPFNVYMARATAGRDKAFQAEVNDIRANAHGWTVICERDDQLSRFWGMTGSPSIMVVDAHGKVAFPFTLLYYRLVNGKWQAPPNLTEALRAVLKTALDE